MRIALIPSAYWPSIGGVEELTKQFAAELSTNDQVEVWTSKSSAPDRPTMEDYQGIRIRRFDFWLPPSRIGPALGFPTRALSAIRGLKAAAQSSSRICFT